MSSTLTQLTSAMGEVLLGKSTKNQEPNKSTCIICLKSIVRNTKSARISNDISEEVLKSIFDSLHIPHHPDEDNLKVNNYFQDMCKECRYSLVQIGEVALYLEQLKEKLNRLSSDFGRKIILNSLGKSIQDFHLWEAQLGRGKIFCAPQLELDKVYKNLKCVIIENANAEEERSSESQKAPEVRQSIQINHDEANLEPNTYDNDMTTEEDINYLINEEEESSTAERECSISSESNSPNPQTNGDSSDNSQTDVNFSQKIVRSTPKKKSRILKCPITGCSGTFMKKSNLNTHMRIHTGEKRFKCSWKGCEWKFGRSDQLRRHMNIHTGYKPHNCRLCKASFHRTDQLTKHIARIHKNKK